MKIGMPFVPLMSVVIGAYMYIRCKPKFLVKEMNPSEVVKAEVASMPKFGGREAMMAVILVLLVIGLDRPRRTCRSGRAHPVCGDGHVSLPHRYLGGHPGRRGL